MEALRGSRTAVAVVCRVQVAQRKPGDARDGMRLRFVEWATAVLGEEELEAGHYTQIRLVISEADVVVDGATYSLAVPSGTFKFVSGFEIVSDVPTELIVDFDAARSIHITGKGEYKITPTLRLINKVQCGSISGQVTNYDQTPVAFAIAGEDTLTSSYADEENGEFKLGFLPEGTYTVTVVDELERTYTSEDVLCLGLFPVAVCTVLIRLMDECLSRRAVFECVLRPHGPNKC